MPLNISTLHRIEEIKEEYEEVKTFKFYSKEIAKESEPGQFIMVWNPGIDEIPISIAEASPSPNGEVEIAIAAIGDCTHSLHQKHVGDLIGLRGPYGKGFTLQGKRICMVAGGYGAAPLRFAARRAKESDKHIVVLEGARSSTELLYIEEFNASCPHSDFVAVENNPKVLRHIIKMLRDIAHPKGIPLAVKISPNMGDPAGLAMQVEQAGADAITAINTLISRPIDRTRNSPLLGNPTGYGGKSGKKLTVAGKQIVFSLCEELKIPVIAVGGIFSAKDVIEYAKNGASLFQVGSALVSEGFEIFPRIKKELKEYLAANSNKNISEVVGEAHRR